MRKGGSTEASASLETRWSDSDAGGGGLAGGEAGPTGVAAVEGLPPWRHRSGIGNLRNPGPGGGAELEVAGGMALIDLPPWL